MLILAWISVLYSGSASVAFMVLILSGKTKENKVAYAAIMLLSMASLFVGAYVVKTLGR